MKLEHIRPEQLMQENARMCDEDIKQILIHKDAFVEVSCPACTSPAYHIVFEKEGFTYVECRECETMFINPRPTLDLLTEYYASSKAIKHWNEKIYPATEETRRNQIFVPRVERVAQLCKKYNAETKSVLDVGAGFGTFCEEIKKLHIFDTVIAVEPSHYSAKACSDKGITVIEKPIEDVKLEGISVVTCFELIEHLFCPGDFLSQCWKLLPYGGLLIITTPNSKGFDLLVLRELSDNIRGPNHLNYFHTTSLSHLLQRCGFEILEAMTPGKLDAEIVRKKLLNNTLDMLHNLFLKYILIDKWKNLGNVFQQFLAENGLSSHLWIVARKI